VVLVLAAGLNLEVRLEGHQVVLRWGSPPPEPPRPDAPPAPAVPEWVAHAAAVEEQVQLLSEIVRTLEKDVDDRDQRRQQELAVLQARLRVLQGQIQRRWSETEDNLKALYLLAKGEKR
jgi:hypothetical protein